MDTFVDTGWLPKDLLKILTLALALGIWTPKSLLDVHEWIESFSLSSHLLFAIFLHPYHLMLIHFKNFAVVVAAVDVHFDHFVDVVVAAVVAL